MHTHAGRPYVSSDPTDDCPVVAWSSSAVAAGGPSGARSSGLVAVSGLVRTSGPEALDECSSKKNAPTNKQRGHETWAI